MNLHLEGTPSENLPDVLATGSATIGYAFLSFSERDPDGRDAEYIEWHTLDHRPEQYRLDGLRHSLRLISTPACRAARAASTGAYDRIDHVQNYLFADNGSMQAFGDLGAALNRAGRMAHRLPSVGFLTARRAGKVAAARAVTGEDVIPFRPSIGVWLMVERGSATAAPLVDLPGVAGVWWFDGVNEEGDFKTDAAGLQVTYCFMDEDPVSCAPALAEAVRQRWAGGDIEGLLAAPFYVAVPYAWDRYLP